MRCHCEDCRPHLALATAKRTINHYLTVCSQYRKALEQIVSCDPNGPNNVADIAKEALATPLPELPEVTPHIPQAFL